MEYTKACTLLGYRVTNTKERNAKLATSCLGNLNRKAPLKFKVACRTLINAA